MAVVLPFRAFRPDEKYVSLVAALPYDVYKREEARETIKDKPLSFLNIDRPETQFPPEQDMYSQLVYDKAREMLDKEIDDKIFIQDELPSYYLYELTMDGKSQTGVVAVSSIDDYLNGICRKHENTVEEKEQDRIKHVDTCSMQTGPIFLCYRDRRDVKEIISEAKKANPLYSFYSEDGIRHQVWRISDTEKIKELEQAFSGMDRTYIADGHHRAASAVKVGLKRRAEDEDGQKTNCNASATSSSSATSTTSATSATFVTSATPATSASSVRRESDYFLSVLFPDTELRILAYNRIIKDLNGLDEKNFLKKLSLVAEVTEISKEGKELLPEEKGIFTMYLSGNWYKLKLKSDIILECKGDPVRSLDVALLQEEILAPVLGIKDPRTDKRIEFVGGLVSPDMISKKVDRIAATAVAFLLYPTNISELLEVADKGLLMPPKSTWFEPKLRSGIFMHAI